MKKTTYWLVIILGCAFAVLSTLPFFLAGTSAIFATVLLDGFLSYYGAILSALGTLALGFIAVYQNKKLTDLQEQVQSTTRSCNIYLTSPKDVSDWRTLKVLTNSLQSVTKNKDYLVISLENFSDAFLKSIEITFPLKKSSIHSDTTAKHHSFITLVNRRTKYYSLQLPNNLQENGYTTIKFTSCYDVATYGDFRIQEFDFINLNDPCDLLPDYDERNPDVMINLNKYFTYYRPKHFNFYGTALPPKRNVSTKVK